MSRSGSRTSCSRVARRWSRSAQESVEVVARRCVAWAIKPACNRCVMRAEWNKRTQHTGRSAAGRSSPNACVPRVLVIVRRSSVPTIVGISPTLVVGGELNHIKVGGVSQLLGYLLGCTRTSSRCAPGCANSPGFGLTIGIRAESAISCARAHLSGVGPKPSGPCV